MKLVETLIDYLRGLENSLAMLKSPGVLLPFVIFTAIQSVVLIACAFFSVPPLSYFMVPLVQFVSGEQALHFPMHFILLPSLYHVLYLPIVIVVGFVLFGRAVFLMGDHFENHGVRMGNRPSLTRSIPSIILIGLAYVLLATIPVVFSQYLSNTLDVRLGGKIFRLIGVILSVSFQALLIYSLVFLRTGTSGALGAIKKSISFARGKFTLTFLLVLTVYIIHRPVDFILSRPDKVVLRFDPEMVFFLLLGGIVLELVTSYVLFSSTASIVLAKKKDGIG